MERTPCTRPGCLAAADGSPARPFGAALVRHVVSTGDCPEPFSMRVGISVRCQEPDGVCLIQFQPIGVRYHPLFSESERCLKTCWPVADWCPSRSNESGKCTVRTYKRQDVCPPPAATPPPSQPARSNMTGTKRRSSSCPLHYTMRFLDGPAGSDRRTRRRHRSWLPRTFQRRLLYSRMRRIIRPALGRRSRLSRLRGSPAVPVAVVDT